MTYSPPDADETKLRVQEHYRRVAVQGSGCCCSPSPVDDASCCGAGHVDSGTQAQIIPEAAVRSARGCGDPVRLARLRPGDVVLDLGAGGGLDVLRAAHQVGHQGFVHGLDMTEEMVALGRANAAKMGADNVAFHHGDIEAIPLPDGSVDVIISNCVVNLTPDKPRALREAFRVLKPGGRLAISDVVLDPDLSGLPLSEDRIRSALSWAGCAAGALTRAEYESGLAEAGFESISVEVRHRYRPDDLLPAVAPARLQDLVPSVVRDLASRFTSSEISARKPDAPLTQPLPRSQSGGERVG